MIRSAQPTVPASDLVQWQHDLKRIVDSGRLFLGEFTEAFECEFATAIGTTYAIAVSSCSAALEIVFRFLRRQHGSGGRVLTGANTFIAVPNAVNRAGFPLECLPVSPYTFSLDVDAAVQVISIQKPAVLLLVHIAGLVDPALPRLLDLCKERRVPVIEDVSHAHGAMLGDHVLGSLGLAGCFSLYATKIITSGVGGMITTNDPDLCRYAKTMRHHGARDGWDLSQTEPGGSDWLMSEANAALGRLQLARLPEFLERRRAIAQLYREHLSVLGGVVECPPFFEDVSPAWYKFPILFHSEQTRNLVMSALHAAEIECGVLYPPLQSNFGRWSMRNAALMNRQLALPVHNSLSDADVDRVCATIIRMLVRRDVT